MHEEKYKKGEGTMEYKLRLIIIGVALFCLSLAGVAPASNVIKTVYFDGQFVAEVNQTNQMLLWPNPYITVGSDGIANVQCYNQYEGDLDEFIIYEGILDATDVLAHYNAVSTSYAAFETAVNANSPLMWLKFADATVGAGDTAANSGSASMDGEYVVLGGSAGFTKITTGVANSAAITMPPFLF